MVSTSDNTERAIAEAELEKARAYAEEQCKLWEQRLNTIGLLLATLKSQSVKFTARTDSMWHHEGETSASATSKYLAKAIQRAGERHQEQNRRRDFQVYWTVTMQVGSGDSSIAIKLSGQTYQHLLPGGEPTVQLRLRQGAGTR